MDKQQTSSSVNDGSDDEIEVTASEVLEKLTEIWINEKFAPDLLESRIELVDCMLAQVTELQKAFAQQDKDLSSSLQKVELERVKYIIASYLRTRLKKIEDNTVHVLEMEACGARRLSAEEHDFAKSFADGMQAHMTELALRHMPSNMQSVDPKKSAPRPNPNKYVFIRVREKQEQVLIDPEEEPFDLDAGTQHIVRYNPVAPFVESGAVILM